MITAHLVREVALLSGIFTLPTLATFLSSRIVHFDDLSTEGSFGLGGALCAALALKGAPVSTILLASTAAGGATGALTSWLHTHQRMNKLMSGLCVTTGLFSCNLALAGAHVSLPSRMLLGSLGKVMIIVGALTACSVLRWFLQTQTGLFVRASGENPRLVASLGKQSALFMMLALALAGGMTGLGGALFALHTGFFSITSSFGVLVAALSSTILASVFSLRAGISLFLGSCLYQAIFAVIISCGINPVWMNAVKALLIIILFSLNTRNAS